MHTALAKVSKVVTGDAIYAWLYIHTTLGRTFRQSIARVRVRCKGLARIELDYLPCLLMWMSCTHRSPWARQAQHKIHNRLKSRKWQHLCIRTVYIMYRSYILYYIICRQDNNARKIIRTPVCLQNKPKLKQTPHQDVKTNTPRSRYCCLLVAGSSRYNYSWNRLKSFAGVSSPAIFKRR